jgi:hypothetical protein
MRKGNYGFGKRVSFFNNFLSNKKRKCSYLII